MTEAYKKQAELLYDAVETNTTAHREIATRLLLGELIVAEGVLIGPYTTLKTYSLSDGTSWTITLASSLSWASDIHMRLYSR